MNTRILRRSLIAAGLVLAGVIAAPAAFARTHVSIGLGFYSPGVSVGYYDGYYPSYGYYAPAPAYYYAPAPVYYDSYPAYGTVYYGGYYGGGYYHRHWRDRDDRGWRGHDRDDWHGDHWRGGGYYHH